MCCCNQVSCMLISTNTSPIHMLYHDVVGRISVLFSKRLGRRILKLLSSGGFGFVKTPNLGHIPLSCFLSFDTPVFFPVIQSSASSQRPDPLGRLFSSEEWVRDGYFSQVTFFYMARVLEISPFFLEKPVACYATPNHATCLH